MIPGPDTVTMSKEHYLMLRTASDFLQRLRAAGVDNWEGYSEACAKDEQEAEDDIYS